jgi:hypothetical protein
MCTEQLSDFHAMFDIWKCVNCGARIDKIILENQKNPSPPDFQSKDISRVSEERALPVRARGVGAFGD